MAQIATTVPDQLAQLEGARILVLGDAHYYPQIVEGILPIINNTARLELKRWGSDFLAETFASPSFTYGLKEELSVKVLFHLQEMLEAPGQDETVVKSIVQTATSIYGLMFRRIISHPQEAWAWTAMTNIKSNILKRMDSASTGVRVCCIKFIQKVVHVQTPGVIADPRRPEQNETSIALVPRNHPLLPLPNLEAEASGLLDRVLDVFHENVSDAILVNATLNCLALLIRSRPAVANKTISMILNFNPLKQANSPMTPRTRVTVKSMERSTRALLKNVNKSNPNGPLAGKIDAYLVRLHQSRSAIFAAPDGSLKRSAPTEPTDGLDPNKRARLAAGPTRFPPLPPPPNSFAELFTLTEDTALSQFDVKVLPIDLINTITTPLLAHVDPRALDEAITAVKARYSYLQKMAQPTPIPAVPLAGPTGIDDEDDYEPEYQPADSELTAADASTTPTSPDLLSPVIELGPFELPKPPPLSDAEKTILSKQTVERVFTMMTSLDSSANQARPKLGINRLAASTNDRDAWVTMMTRLATRAPSGLDELANPKSDSDTKSEEISLIKPNPVSDPERPSLANAIRQTLFAYILEDFRARLNAAISWLNEEWYVDKLSSPPSPSAPPSMSSARSSSLPPALLPNYTLWLHKLFRTVLPYLSPEPRDSRLLVRFLSEIPAVTPETLDMVQSLAADPERVGMAVMALQYLILMRVPVREMALQRVEGIWKSVGSRAAEKVLGRWKPGVLEEQKLEEKQGDAKGLVKGESGAGAPERNNLEESKNMETEKANGVEDPGSVAESQKSSIPAEESQMSSSGDQETQAGTEQASP